MSKVQSQKSQATRKAKSQKAKRKKLKVKSQKVISYLAHYILSKLYCSLPTEQRLRLTACNLKPKTNSRYIFPQLGNFAPVLHLHTI
jgi:hypothetical protein